MSDDEKITDADMIAKTMATIVRLSEILNVTLEDATAIYMKLGTAIGVVEKNRKSVS
jgi:hypothetical protein